MTNTRYKYVHKILKQLANKLLLCDELVGQGAVPKPELHPGLLA